MRLTTGETIDGRYRLIERIGSGGMADVWRATDTDLGRDVAVKVLHENFARDEEFVERFRREASAAAGLQHPNIVGVYDRGSYEDSYYIAMELVEGRSLRDLIDGGLEVSEAVEICRQILAAAGFAHSKGIVHRDLKPMNVLIDADGRVRVTDFGIARAGGSEMTRTGSVMGTAQYLSPEQAQGMETNAASDIYSIGIMLFEMLCGSVPFEGDNAVAIAMKQVSEVPATPSRINPLVSPALDAVVLRALAKDPHARFASATEMSAALDAAEQDPARGPGHTQRYEALVAEQTADDKRKRWIVAAAILALIALGIGLWLLLKPDNVEVPDVAGKSEAQATIELRRAEFEVEVERQTSPVDEGEVIETDPRGGVEADKGSIVTLTVSDGPGTIAVPDVDDVPLATAKRRINNAGFEVGRIQREPSDSIGKGRVISSDPSGNTEVAAGEAIDLTVSSGTRMRAVPSVVGQDRAAATTTLRNAGFVVNSEPEDSDEPENQVLSQTPAGGERAKVGSEVSISYSSGVGTISLDDFVGQKQAAAERRLGNLGLNVSIVAEDVSDEADDGIVLDQAPAAGTNVSPGDRVTLTVGELTEPDPPPEPENPPPDPGGNRRGSP